MGIMSPITGKLFDKFGPRVLAILGLGITAVSTYQLANLELNSSYEYIIFIYSLRMFGMAMIMMPIMTNGLNQLPSRLNPHGTAINNTAQQVSGSIGTAVLVTIMNSVAKTEGERIMAGIDPTTFTEATQVKVMQESLLAGIQYSFYVALGMNLLALVLALFVKRVDTSAEAVRKIESQNESATAAAKAETATIS
jgi:MFS family permease